ncbi:MAG: hypothetical protein V7668_04220 [Cereibacter changlensis]|uniref:DUF2934 domain-containing protein n=2 Tax=Cereibacter changlensis TaxID=402884 RepID=A0A2T4JZV7_9RHOB|nr:hypothetical protein [Cereibacter changlensis]PTE23465.1 hypothetical protein C5F48_01760 [Cereibacter changlensis JA139]PZX52969.1 hypothetical protein LX76_02600 [Cereibacter changlensis]
MNREEFDAWDKRVEQRAELLWQEAGSPEGGFIPYLDQARELLAIEENPHSSTHPIDEHLPDGESLLAVENQGEFPTTTDQGEEQAYPKREDRPKWD